MGKNFNEFNVGDIHLFKRSFSSADFKEFSLLSGDNNPLHHDVKFSKSTIFKQPIVPLHLASAPLSRIAGMVFPGDNSLYLGHEIKALKSIPYGVKLTYSAKIIEKNERDRILTIRTLDFNQDDTFIEAIQKIQSREDNLIKNNKYTSKNI